MHADVRPMSPEDYAEVLALWRRTEGMGLSDADSAAAIARFLARNAGLSPVARGSDGKLVGAALCGHDGRRGFLYHLAVDAAHRGQGVAHKLVEFCLERLGGVGIQKCNVLVFRDNPEGAGFWQHNGWSEREDLRLFQRVLG